MQLGRILRTFSSGLAAGLAVTVFSITQPTTAEVEMRNCLDIPGRVSPGAHHRATTTDLQLVCKGGYRGPAGGSATAVPRGGGYIPRDTYGTPGARANKVDGSAVRMRKLRRLAREENVPWPRRINRMPKTARYPELPRVGASLRNRL